MLTIKGKEVFNTLEELVDPVRSALLLIDIQNDYVTAGGYFDKLGLSAPMRGIVSRTKRILETARDRGVFVVHVQMTLYPDFLAESAASLRARLLRFRLGSGEQLDPYCIAGTWGCQIVDELAPMPNEIVVRKHRASAFIGTDMDMILRSNEIKSVVIAGVVTQGCVLATANDAPFFEYYPVLLRDCIASQEQKLHDAALYIMSRTKDVVDSEEVLKIWRKPPGG